MRWKIIPVRGWLLLAGLLLPALSAWAADITARLDRNNIVEGETVTLVIQTEDPGQSLDADLSVLEADFDLLDRRTETQMSIVNGRQTAVVRLMLTLEPRRTGSLTIPPLKFAGATTEALPVKVDRAPEPEPGEMPAVFIEMSVEPEEGPYYVHSQLSLTVKIFYQQNLTEASINPPAPEQTSVRLLDELPYPAERNGTRYRVLQRSYAVFPERSGTLEIPPLRLTGRLIERSGTGLWQPSVRGRRIAEESEPMSIEVLPRPAGFSGDHWLPARELTLSQQLTEADGIRVGEPVTRTVIIDAVGLEENMLEEPRWPELPNARIYPDQPQGISRDDGRWVRGHKEFRYAVVPEQAGTLVLPELRLDWWDTEADQARTAVLPEMRVEVVPLQLVPSATAQQVGKTGLATPANGQVIAGTGHPGWKYATLVLAVLWIGTLGLMVWRRQPGAGAEKPEEQPQGEADHIKALKRACLQGDAGQARIWLRRWLGRFGPAGAQGSIRQWAAWAGPGALRDALNRLEDHGYREIDPGAWDGAALWRAFAEWRKEATGDNAGATGPSPDLYRVTR